MNATQQTERINTASIISDQFSTATRDDGTTYTTALDDSQARELVRHVHFTVFDGMLPHDWIYENTRAIVELYADNDNEMESAYELADVYTSDLIEWSAYPAFRAFVDEAFNENANSGNQFWGEMTLDTIIRIGQEAALREMEYVIGEWLNQ